MKKNIVFYPFLFAIYPVLFYIGHNNLEFSIFNIGVGLLFLLASGFLFFLLNIFIKNKDKSALIVLLYVFLFYLGGGNCSKDGGLSVSTALGIVVVVFVLVTVLSYFIAKFKKDLSKLSYILNFVAVVLTVLAAFTIIQNRHEINKFNSSSITPEIEMIIKNASKDKNNLPNIYYIIPDEYAGFDTLKNHYGFDNKEFKKFLLDKGFYIPDKSSSNYGYTAKSVNASLNMIYPESKISKKYEDEYCVEQVFDNNLVKILKAYGYNTTIVLNEWHLIKYTNKKTLSNWDAVINPVSVNSLNELPLSRQTILRFILFDYFRKEMRKTKTVPFSILDEKIKIKSKKPEFIYLHVLLPHPILLFDENGNPQDTQKQDYLGQLKYTNKLIENSVNSILENDKNSIIIIQSDHGYRAKEILNKNQKAVYNNITAIYLPEKYRQKTGLYSTITPVNIFRTILNPVLDINLKKLEDKNL